MDLIAFANELINKYYSSGFLGYFDSFRGGELAVETSRWVLQNRPDVAYTVLSQLRARGFASSDIVRVARGILDAVPQQNANNLAQTAAGNILIRQIGQILKYSAPGNAKSPRSIKIKTALDLATPKAKQFVAQPRQLSQVEIAEYTKRAKTGEVFNSNIIWELPNSGTGFIVYNRNDVAIDGLDQIGTKDAIEAMINLASQWNTSGENPNKRILQIGDISRPGGLHTSQHRGHKTGKNVDIRILRKDGGTGSGIKYYSTLHDRDLTKAFFRFSKKLYPRLSIRFNDGEIAGVGEFSYVKKDAGGGTVHDDHYHLEF